VENLINPGVSTGFPQGCVSFFRPGRGKGNFSTHACGKLVHKTTGFPQGRVFHSFSTGFSTGFPQELRWKEKIPTENNEFSTGSTCYNMNNN
jgi:hypothetical protein